MGVQVRKFNFVKNLLHGIIGGYPQTWYVNENVFDNYDVLYIVERVLKMLFNGNFFGNVDEYMFTYNYMSNYICLYVLLYEYLCVFTFI